MKRTKRQEDALKRKRAYKVARMKSGQKSAYAEKHAGGRVTIHSPLHPDHVTDWNHPQARVALKALKEQDNA